MLKIGKEIFASNLSLTKRFCHIQMNKSEKDNAKVFRSFNPLINDKPMFLFEFEKFNFEIQPNLNCCTLTKWSVEPTERANEKIVDQLFEAQMNFKQEHLHLDENQIYEGDILISQIDCTVIDGASEVQSLGLVDIYDIPPIDTWFYLTKNNMSRLLFAWIPKEYRYYANEAVLVNCVDCINWFKTWYAEDHKSLIGE